MRRVFLGLTIFAAICLLSTPSVSRAAGQDKHASTALQKAIPANPADFVGSETCATCHSEESKKFDSNPHAKLALEHGGAGNTCESCHGSGKAHVESGGDATKILQFSKASPKKIDETCLSCHAGSHPNFERSPHALAGVSCISCHSSHSPKTDTKMLKVAEPQLCFGCHADSKAAFAQPFHHKINEGLMSCSDCHNPHGTFGNSNLKTTADQNAICTKCHTETRGPFVYEHAPVKAEGCVGCHTPHGSQNARLLNMPNINTLCNQCHSPVASATVHSMNAGSSELTPCTNCHTNIHGSNLNPAFLR